jgi:hypothetical protein
MMTTIDDIMVYGAREEETIRVICGGIGGVSILFLYILRTTSW